MALELLDILAVAPPFTLSPEGVADTTPPTVTAASVNASGTTLSLTFSEAVTGVDSADYALSGGHTIGTASGSGTSWSFPITGTVYGAETVSLSYDGTSTIDAAANPMVVFSGRAVTNNSTAVQGEAEGIIALRRLVLLTAGQDNFDAEFNLDSDALVADEATVQTILTLADNYVGSRAYRFGVTADADPSSIDSDMPGFPMLQYWASRWARAQGHLLRGTVSSEAAGGTEGQMTDMRKEAAEQIDEILSTVATNTNTDDTTAGQDGIGVITLTGCPTTRACCEFPVVIL